MKYSKITKMRIASSFMMHTSYCINGPRTVCDFILFYDHTKFSFDIRRLLFESTAYSVICVVPYAGPIRKLASNGNIILTFPPGSRGISVRQKSQIPKGKQTFRSKAERFPTPEFATYGSAGS